MRQKRTALANSPPLRRRGASSSWMGSRAVVDVINLSGRHVCSLFPRDERGPLAALAQYLRGLGSRAVVDDIKLAATEESVAPRQHSAAWFCIICNGQFLAPADVVKNAV